MIAFRFDRGGLKEAMDTLVLFSSYTQLYEYIGFVVGCNPLDIIRDYYCYSDDRIGWKDIYIVRYSVDDCPNQYYVAGFLSENYEGGY